MKLKTLIAIFAFTNISCIFAQADDYTLEISRKWVLSEGLFGFSIEVPIGVVKSLDIERTSWIQGNVPADAPISIYKCNIDPSYDMCPPFHGKMVYEIPLSELLQRSTVLIPDESLTSTLMILKAEILSDSLIRLSIERESLYHGIL